uniref:Centrosomal protein of 44 kDa n=1 Tax=Calidris pygmaea TaxID=425635 RepID=A0A8C3K3E8_9CHAR
MATGDLKGSIRKIEQGLRLLNYPRDVDYTVLVKGDPAAFLPIISYCFTSFSTHIAELLVKCDVELTAKSDLRFIEAIYKLLRDQFQYKPVLTKQQFLQFGFAERKMQIVCDIINCVVKKHKELSNSNKVLIKYEFFNFFFLFLFFQHTEKKPQVERHTGNEVSVDLHPLPLPAQRGDKEELFLDHDVVEVKGKQVRTSILRCQDNSELEFLKSQLADCQEKLQKLDWMEDKLHSLEEKLKGKVIIDEKDWNNLLSRVLLLETQLLLQSKKVSDLAIGEQKGKGDTKPESFPTDRERKEERPERLHQPPGRSSPLPTDPSPEATTVRSPDLTDLPKVRKTGKSLAGSFLRSREKVSISFSCINYEKQGNRAQLQRGLSRPNPSDM